MTAKTHAADEMADQYRELRFASARGDRDTRDRTNQCFAGRQGFGDHQGEFMYGIGAGQFGCGLRRQFLDRIEEALSDLVGPQKTESVAQRLRIFRPDRADQHFTTVEQPFVFVPLRESVGEFHGRILAGEW